MITQQTINSEASKRVELLPVKSVPRRVVVMPESSDEFYRGGDDKTEPQIYLRFLGHLKLITRSNKTVLLPVRAAYTQTTGTRTRVGVIDLDFFNAFRIATKFPFSKYSTRYPTTKYLFKDLDTKELIHFNLFLGLGRFLGYLECAGFYDMRGDLDDQFTAEKYLSRLYKFPLKELDHYAWNLYQKSEDLYR